MAGHAITIASDYKDKDGNKYIIRVKTMVKYLTDWLGAPEKVTAASAKGKQGIIYFDVREWHDATGHVTLWDGTACLDGSDYFAKATAVYIWSL